MRPDLGALGDVRTRDQSPAVLAPIRRHAEGLVAARSKAPAGGGRQGLAQQSLQTRISTRNPLGKCAYRLRQQICDDLAVEDTRQRPAALVLECVDFTR